jgi:hypothetical protein
MQMLRHAAETVETAETSRDRSGSLRSVIMANTGSLLEKKSCIPAFQKIFTGVVFIEHSSTSNHYH